MDRLNPTQKKEDVTVSILAPLGEVRRVREEVSRLHLQAGVLVLCVHRDEKTCATGGVPTIVWGDCSSDLLADAYVSGPEDLPAALNYVIGEPCELRREGPLRLVYLGSPVDRARNDVPIGRTYPLPAEGQLVLGRLQSNEVVIDAAVLPRRMAHVCWSGGQVVLQDLASANGVYMCSRRIDQAILHNGDQFALAGHFFFRLDGAEQ